MRGKSFNALERGRADSSEMEYIYVDASFSPKSKIGGVAVVVPEWCDKKFGKWFSRWHIKIFCDESHVILYSACKCSDSTDAEKRALGLAFLVANDIITSGKSKQIEIISDSLANLNEIIINEINDPIISALSNLKRKHNIIISKVKAHNGNPGNELADRWAKIARKNFTKIKEKSTMRMPFKNSSNNYSNNTYTRNNKANPFEGSTEMDIRSLTERVLSDENNIGYVTPEGKVMPRNMAYSSGNRNGIELVKQRIWGFDYDEEINDCEYEDDEEYPVKIIYSDEALKMIISESLKSPDTETGGALIGNWQRDSDGYITVNVERATGPGSESVRNPALFSPHIDYYRSRIAYFRERNNWDYLGEWHKHPGNFDSLSETDINTAHELIYEEGWPMLLLPIVNNINGQLTMENNIILSPQLGGEIMTHIDTVELYEI